MCNFKSALLITVYTDTIFKSVILLGKKTRKVKKVLFLPMAEAMVETMVESEIMPLEKL